MKTLTYWNMFSQGGGTPIAHMMTGIDAPKLKFLFTAEIIFRSGKVHGAIDMRSIELDLKSASRPNVSFNLEDINYYNYRAKVGTKTNFGQVRITFYDDPQNEAHGMLWKYLEEVSPLARGKTVYASTEGDEVVAPFHGTTYGPLDYEDGPISLMRIAHHYLVGSETKKKIIYSYVNPKIESIEFDELDMSSSEASLITVTFAAESVSMVEE